MKRSATCEMPSNSSEDRKKIIDYLIRAAAQAPSWYNCQPWKFEVDEDCIIVILDKSRDQSFYDWGSFNSLMACGAAVQNIVVAAKARGIQTSVVLLPNSSNNSVVANVRLDLEKVEASSLSDQGLEKAIWERHTNSLMFDNRSLSKLESDALAASINDSSGIGLHLLTKDEDKEKVFTAAALAEQIRFSRRDLHEQLHRMIRWTDEEANADKSGYTLPSMGICGFGKTFFRMTRPWAIMRLMNVFGANKNQAQRACLGLTHCAAIGLLTVKSRTPKDLLVAGQAMQQLWLVVTTLGLDMHPHNSIAQFSWAKELGGSDLFNRREQDVLNEASSIVKSVFAKVDFAGGETGVFLFRIGNGEPVKGYTLRKDVVCR